MVLPQCDDARGDIRATLPAHDARKGDGRFFAALLFQSDDKGCSSLESLVKDDTRNRLTAKEFLFCARRCQSGNVDLSPSRAQREGQEKIKSCQVLSIPIVI